MESTVANLQNQIVDLGKQIEELKSKLEQAEQERTYEKASRHIEKGPKSQPKSIPSTPSSEDTIIVPSGIPGETIGDFDSIIPDGGEYDNSPGSGEWAGVIIY